MTFDGSPIFYILMVFYDSNRWIYPSGGKSEVWMATRGRAHKAEVDSFFLGAEYRWFKAQYRADMA